MDAVRKAMTQVLPEIPGECWPIYPTREMLENFTEEQWTELLGED